MIVALIPAHNEEDGIADAVRSVYAQVDHVVVVADRCTDRTVVVAHGEGAQIIETRGNTAKKAGALNQAIEEILPKLTSADAVLVLDADSVLAPDFIANAMRAVSAGWDAVGGVFRGREGGGFIGWCQRNEYVRYARDVKRLSGKALVPTGTATLILVPTITRVIEARRDGTLPGRAALYDEEVLTEDNELGFAIRSLGMDFVSPADCTLTTEVMETWRSLAQQRLRWKRGALENLRQYGFNRMTAPYWGRQVLSAVGILVTALYLVTLAWSFTAGFHVHPIWLGITAVFAVERLVTVRERGLMPMLLGALIIVEFPYDVFLQGVQARAFAQSLLGIERKW